MNRNGILLGVLATGSQVLLLREIVSSLYGDELFIGLTLCFWLLWGAIGALVGGRSRIRTNPELLFALGAMAAPIAIALVRLSATLGGHTVGEPVSFTYGVLLSLSISAPLSLLCGWLFAAIVRDSGNQPETILQVYFSEGLGAFAVGVVVAFLTGFGVSTFAAAVVVTWAVFLGVLPWERMLWSSRVIVALGMSVAAGGSIVIVAPAVDADIDGYKYRPYQVANAFDTPYSHEAILLRSGVHVVVTDSRVEQVQSDFQTAENLLIPPLAFNPAAKRILLIGDAHLSLGQLSRRFAGLDITTVDPRPQLDEALDALIPGATINSVADDPVGYLKSTQSATFDIVILPLDESGSIRSCRLLTETSLTEIKRVLKPAGILHVVTTYDTDRYNTGETAAILGMIDHTLRSVFPDVCLWPGTETLLLAGDSAVFNLEPDSLYARIDALPYKAQFVNRGYLEDRLSPEKVDRLADAIRVEATENSLEHPVLANLQTINRGRVFATDRWLGILITKWNAWLAIVLAVGLLTCVFWTIRAGLNRSFGLLLYFTAGLTSLSLELLSFYVYQCTAGSLYSSLAALIGSFMLGLAVGTRVAARASHAPIELPTLVVLGATTLYFAFTCLLVQPETALVYHMAFQFVVALCSGALFAAATHRYLRDRAGNGGLGYAFDLIGASIGSLFTLALLLPALGLHTLLYSIAGLIGTMLIMCVVVIRRSA